MTVRELVAVLLVSLGAVLLIVGAALYGGAPAAFVTAGVLLVGGGVLLGIDNTQDLPIEPPSEPDLIEEGFRG